MSQPAADSTPHVPTVPPQRPKVPEDHIFRRTFLARFWSAEYVTSFEGVGVALADLMNESGSWGQDTDEPLTRTELRSAGEDVALLAQFIEAVAESRFSAVLEPESMRLAEKAERWAVQLAAVAESIRGEVSS